MSYAVDNISQYKLMKIESEAYLTLDKEVKKGSTSASIHVPKAWAGCRVRILLMDNPESINPVRVKEDTKKRAHTKSEAEL